MHSRNPDGKQFSWSNSKRKLLYGMASKDDSITVAEYKSPAKPSVCTTAPGKRRVHHSSGGTGDMDWQRRMDGFDGISLETSNQGKGNQKKRGPARKLIVPSATLQCGDDVPLSPEPPETQQQIEDWGSSDEDRNITPLACFPKRHRSGTNNPRSAHVWKYKDSPESAISIDDLNSPDSKQTGSPAETGKSFTEKMSRPAVSIAGFESEEEEGGCEDLNENVYESEESMSPVIATPRSQSPEPSLPTSTLPVSTASKPKASQWLKTFQLQSSTPEKPERENIEDSAKKKKPKYVKDGLAENLQRQIQHMKSSHTFWTHKINSSSKDIDTSKIISIRLTSFEKAYSLIRARSIIESSPGKEDKRGQKESIIALFSEAVWTQKQLTSGVSLDIHPPWQILHQANGERILLGTTLCQVMGQTNKDNQCRPSPRSLVHNPDAQPDSSSKGQTTNVNDLEPCPEFDEVVIAKWSCPCSQDSSLPTEKCPAHTHPVNPAQSTLQLVCPQEPTTHPAGLEYVHQTQPTQSRTPHSMLQGIEQCGGGGISFLATIQRIFKKRHRFCESGAVVKEHPHSEAYSLLLQDSSGFVCQLMLPPGAQESQQWRSLLTGGQGALYEFSGLRILQRTNRNKSARLFSMIDSVWRAEAVTEKPIASQDSSQQSEAAENIQCPGFCYVLQAPPGESSCKQHTGGSTVSPVFTPRVYKTVTNTTSMVMGDEPRRVSVTAQVVLIKELLDKDRDSPSRRIVHVVNTSDTPGSMAISLLESFSVDDTVLLESRFFNFNDILVHNGFCSMDEYSEIAAIASTDANSSPEKTMNKIASIADSSKQGDLCRLQGQICGVEEDTAFSWLVCPRCKADKLQGGTSKQPFLYCTTCKKGVSEPVTMMNLEVHVKSDTLQHASIKLKLLQGTIQKLLPAESEEEGYDMQCVLGKPIGPLVGEVMHVSTSPSICSISMVQVSLLQ